VGELINQRTGTDFQHVPYKGGGQAMGDVVGGQIPLVMTSIATTQQFLKSGRVKGMGVSSAQRSPAAPEVPTFIESGLDGMVVNSWVGILAPKATPRPVVDRLQREIAAVLKEPDVRERYAVLGNDPVGNTPDEFAAQIRADLAQWKAIVERAKIRID
jgi:tripartite-type tricarboxylate transporter receptor subunit TctC